MFHAVSMTPEQLRAKINMKMVRRFVDAAIELAERVGQ